MATKDYAAIAKSRIRKPGAPRPPRLLVYGRNKKGKTRFCNTAPNILILDPEDGTAYEKSREGCDVWPLDQWDDLNEAYNYLKSGKHSYEWVALDGITKIANMSLRWVMKEDEERSLNSRPGQVDQRTYGKSGEMIKGVLHNFHSLRNLGLIITAQERMIEVNELGDSEDEDAETVSHQFVPDLPKGCRSAVNSVVDLIGRIYVVRGEFQRKIKREGKIETISYNMERRLWVGPHGTFETGYRSEYNLPDVIRNPTVPRVTRAIQEGKV